MSLYLKLTALFFFIFRFCHAQQSEYIYVHFDKDIYLPGETIWFKAYLYDNGLPSAASTNFYAAVYDEHGKLLQQKLYPVYESTCNGDFVLPDTIKVDRVQFVAYTKAMMMDSSRVFKKTISVYKKDQQQLTETVPGNVNLRFFPEGGNWVTGVNNFIAYKAWYDDGSPAQVSGVIVDEITKAPLDSFSTDKLGLGKIQINPQHSIYIANWSSPGGQPMQTQLPPAIESGITFHAELLKKELYYIINKNATADNFETLHLLAQKGNEEIYKADLLIGNKTSLVSKFSVDSVPSGIIQITLFDKNWIPLQERIVFVNPPTPKFLLVDSSGRNRIAKAKNTIEITMPDTLETNLSASIADINFYEETGRAGIMQELLVESQLTGLNNSICRAFETAGDIERDLVMMTHGWRKYNWKHAANHLQAPVQLDNYITVNAYHRENAPALHKAEVLALVVNDNISGKQFYNVDFAGKNVLNFPGMVFYDSAKFYYRLKRNNELIEDLSINKENGIAIPATIAALKSGSIGTKMPMEETETVFDVFAEQQRRKFNELQTMRTVIVKGKYVNPVTKRMMQIDEKYATGMFAGITRGFQLNLLDDPKAEKAFDLYSYIKYSIPAVIGISGGTGNRKLYPCTMSGNDKCDPFVVYVNENEVDGSFLELIPISQVAYVKYTPGIVINSTNYTSNGTMYVYTKKGDEPGAAEPDNMHIVKIKGYDVAKEFFNPDYSSKESRAVPDYRSTLYWNPYIITDKNNRKIKIEYYNNDISKKLLLRIEGFNTEGTLIHLEKIIE